MFRPRRPRVFLAAEKGGTGKGRGGRKKQPARKPANPSARKIRLIESRIRSLRQYLELQERKDNLARQEKLDLIEMKRVNDKAAQLAASIFTDMQKINTEKVKDELHNLEVQLNSLIAKGRPSK